MSHITRRRFLTSTAMGLLATQFPLRTPSELYGALLRDDPVLERRRRYRDILLNVLDPTRERADRPLNGFGDASFEAWLERTGELPPDFLTMPSFPFLPNPLVMLDPENPAPITSSAQWEQQRDLIRSGFEQWVFGQMPPAPTNLRSRTTDTVQEGDTMVHHVLLEFGPAHQATLRLQVIIPRGDGPFPVLLTNHQRRRAWANTAVRRGYVTCIYEALDRTYGDVDDSDAWIDVYPENDWSQIARWAWGAMRAVDFLVAQRYVDPARIAVGGHSRNAKQALLAAAFDERIAAVVDSRGNSGSSLPWRFTEDMYVQESIEEITGGLPYWFHPRLRFFVGREDKLPVDANLLMALVAPRGLLISHAYQEHHGNPLGIEHAYRSVREVYRFLGAEDRVGLYQQPGEHPSSVEDVERYFDFFDTVFARASFPKPEIWVHGYSYERWKRSTGEDVDPLSFPERSVGDFLPSPRGSTDRLGWADVREDIRSRIRWTLGEEPAGLPQPARDARRSVADPGWRGEVFDRPAPGYDVRRLPFGDDLVGYVFEPPRAETEDAPGATGGAGGRRDLPCVVWLHPYSYATGFDRYVYWGPLYQQGFAVACFDQIGFGTRTDAPVRFYERYPTWSLLGKMVADTRAMIDALVDSLGRYDTNQIYLQGYALGARVALMTAALDDRVAGITVAGGFTPLRLAGPEKGIEGIHHYSHIHGLMPRLGAFVGHESRVPVDYDEIIAAIAPRPVHVVTPTMDRHAPVDDVRAAVEAARGAYQRWGAGTELTLETPEDFNRYPAVWRRQTDWVTLQAGLELPASPRGTEAE